MILVLARDKWQTTMVNTFSGRGASGLAEWARQGWRGGGCGLRTGVGVAEVKGTTVLGELGGEGGAVLGG